MRETRSTFEHFYCELTNRDVTVTETAVSIGVLGQSNGRSSCQSKRSTCPRRCIYMGGAGLGQAAALDPRTGKAPTFPLT